MTRFNTKYGYFTDGGREYVITRPDTPRPWVNIIANPDYGFVISQTGSGYSWWKNSHLARVTRWLQDLVKDEWGKYIYVRDRDSKDFWSLTWKPTCPNFDIYEVRYGMGYAVITSKLKGIKSVVTAFVPPDEPIEIWKVVVKNEGDGERHLSLFNYLEWCLGNSDDVHREFQKTFINTWFDPKLGAAFARKKKPLVPKYISAGLAEFPIAGFNSVSEKIISHEGDKENFMGRYRSLVNPLALENGTLTNTTGDGHDPISSLQVDLDLGPGEEKTVVFTIGYMEDPKAAAPLIKKYQKAEEADIALGRVRKSWDNLLSGVKVHTPDESFDILTNHWLKYQAISARLWAKTAYYQFSGGYGFRDQLQDSLVFLSLKPELCKKQILMHAAHQFTDGTVHHWWHQLSSIGAVTNMTDDLLWLIYVLLDYLEETKDFVILNIKTPYLDGPAGTIYQHCTKAIDKVLSRFSKRGLPLIGDGDWNDGFNLIGTKMKGESVWLAQFLYDILLRFSQIADRKKDKKRAKFYVAKAGKLKRAVNRYCWDGKWYIAATRDDGKKVASSKCKTGKIYLMTQAWGILSSVSTEDRKLKSIQALERYLWDEYGPLLIAPPFNAPDENIGYITRYSPGVRENGAVYTHAACWAVMAECYLGRGDKAFEMYSSFCPIKRGMSPDLYKAEPYVTAGNTNGPAAFDHGAAGWTWYTGSAAWLYRVSTNWILGVRPTYEGLLIDPCIPKKWNGFSIRRAYGNAVYNIKVENPKHVSRGVKVVYLDGRRMYSGIIRNLNDHKAHSVRVIMG